jgi:hypothetical protein
MKRLISFLLAFGVLTAFGQSDTTDLKAAINANFPDNTGGFITPLKLRTVAEELMRSNANLFERNEMDKALTVTDSIKSDEGFYKWNGSAWEELIDAADTSVWARSGGFVLPLEFSDKLRVDTAQIDGNIYPDGSGVNIGRSDAKFDTVFANVVSSTCACVHTVKLEIPTAEVLTLNSVPKAFGLTVPAGYYAKVLDVDASMIYNTTQYATNGNIGVRYVGANGSVYGFDDNGFLFGALSRTVSGTKVMIDGLTDTQIIEATDIEVYVETGDPTAGDSDITIYLTYIVVEL